MIRYALLVKDGAVGHVYARYLTDVLGVPDDEITMRCVGTETNTTEGLADFMSTKPWLEEQLKNSLRSSFITNLVVITDLDGRYLSNFDQMNPLQRMADWRRVLGMLILSFPEIQWIFVSSAVKGVMALPIWWTSPHQPHSSLKVGPREQNLVRDGFALERAGYVALFDGSGLRNAIRRTIQTATTAGAGLTGLALRHTCAVALDDEPHYAIFHAYTAYRFGFRSIPLVTYELARHVFGVPDPNPRAQGILASLVFEDVFLELPDGPQGLSRLYRERRTVLPGIERVPHRVIVTSGQRQAGDTEKTFENRAYLQGQKAEGRNIDFVQKPHSGIFTLWEKSRLERRLFWFSRGRAHRGRGAGYIWPPRSEGIDRTEHTHSAPGTLQVIANTLLSRAQEIRSNVRSLEEAVRGAVLSTDAMELLIGRTPTTSVEALSLKHEFEVIAEIQFVGADYELNLNPRFMEIRRDVAVISRSFHPSNRKSAELNAEIRIISSLVRIFREKAQYEEEQACLNHVRRLRSTLWLCQKPSRYLLWPAIRYVEALLASFPRFLLALACWVVVLAILYSQTAADPSWYLGLEDAMTSFFSIGAPIHEGAEAAKSFGYVSVVCLAIIAGFVHLGVFVSHLYSIVSRR